MNIQKAIELNDSRLCFGKDFRSSRDRSLLLTLVPSFAFHAGAKTNPTAR
jgi:hypothetical protein